MKTIILLTTLLLSQLALASQDSVAVFYRPEKVIVLINERIQAGVRLQEFMNHFGATDSFMASNDDESIVITCGQSSTSSSCKFIFTPAQDVVIKDRTVTVKTSLRNFNLNNNGEFKMEFASSMNDKFFFTVSADGDITMTGSKILRTSH